MITRVDADKWNRIYQTEQHGNIRPARVLAENQHLLPASGKALDAACGLGANALLLAEHGLQTSAWDISSEAITRLQKRAMELAIPLNLEQRDIVTTPPAADSFDIIVVSYFLDRTLSPYLKKALRQNGIIYYQTFIKAATGSEGPKNPAYRLDSNELLSLFSPLHIILYKEEGLTGDLTQGFRNEAMLIAQRQ